jgi:hypothetical protein
MRMIATLLLGLPFSLAAAQEAELNVDDIRRLIAQHHPAVYAVADTALDRVIFVVDSHGKYVKSVAGRMEPSEVTTAEAMFMRLASHDDSPWTACVTPDTTKSAARPSCSVDGARVDRIDIFQMLAIKSLEASSRSVAITTDSPTMARFRSLDIPVSRVDNMMNIKPRAGMLGSKTTYVTVFYLKPGQ